MAFKMKAKGFGNNPMKKNFPSAFKQDDDKVVKYSDLPEDQRDAARKYNMDTYGTLNPTAEANKFGVTKNQLANFHKKSIKLQDMYKQTGRDAIKNPISEQEYKSDVSLSDVEKARKRAPQRYTGLSDDRIMEILRKEAKRKAKRAAKIKDMRARGANPNKT
tara:strand:+ start:864 stop:1349 length:486 start_codon:yes stop_codon:yes gene_type:complete